MSPSNDGEKSQSDVEASQQSDEGEIHGVICPSREGQTQRSNTHFQLWSWRKKKQQEQKQAWQLKLEMF